MQYAGQTISLSVIPYFSESQEFHDSLYTTDFLIVFWHQILFCIWTTDQAVENRLYTVQWYQFTENSCLGLYRLKQFKSHPVFTKWVKINLEKV